MRKGLLWFGSLTCLIVAGLVAYWWFTSDPLASAYDRIAADMTLQEAIDIVGKPPASSGDHVHMSGDGKVSKLWGTEWKGNRYTLTVLSQGGRVVVKMIDPEPESLADKVVNWVRAVRNPPAPVPAIVPVAVPVPVPVGENNGKKPGSE